MTVIGAVKSVSNFNAVLEQVKAAGLLKKKPSFYIIRLAVISLIAGGLWTGSAFVGIAAQSHGAWILMGFLAAGLLG